MYFGTEVAEKVELNQDQVTPETETETETEMEQILGEGDAESQSEAPEGEDTTLAESMLELLLSTTALKLVETAGIIGRSGVHSVCNAILMLPVEGGTSPETKAAIKAFLKSEAKRLVAGALAEGQELPEGLKQSAVAGN